MADLGEITVLNTRASSRPHLWSVVMPNDVQFQMVPPIVDVRVIAAYVPDINPITVLTDKSISGTVTNSSGPAAGHVVRVYHRATGVQAGGTRTNASGQFTVSGLIGEANGYFVIAHDAEGGEVFNAAVGDLVTAA